MFLLRTWNDGIMEYWNVEDPAFIGIDFKGNFLFNINTFHVKWNFYNKPLPHFPFQAKGQKPIVPSFQYSTIPIMNEAN